ncbi:BQ5605_C009g05415 [Microbotryum silenes-dioicae]|uniref:BQ5605_C009g05415 protein n=1 Tax=Microbotryum silenes-dioicae TaxID=796604 RepID=A0A2X0P8G2_9BASI|nr:BQ5605_C009g05415 [Microbotryum silenes-dioicae]
MRKPREGASSEIWNTGRSRPSIGHVQESPMRIRSGSNVGRSRSLDSTNECGSRSRKEGNPNDIHSCTDIKSDYCNASIRHFELPLASNFNCRNHLSKIRKNAVSRVSETTNKIDPYQEEPNTLYMHQTASVWSLRLPRWLRMDEMCIGTAAGQNRDRCEHYKRKHTDDADWPQGFPSNRPSLPATSELFIEACKKKYRHELMLGGLARFYDLGLINIGIGCVSGAQAINRIKRKREYMIYPNASRRVNIEKPSLGMW